MSHFDKDQDRPTTPVSDRVNRIAALGNILDKEGAAAVGRAHARDVDFIKYAGEELAWLELHYQSVGKAMFMLSGNIPAYTRLAAEARATSKRMELVRACVNAAIGKE